MSSQTMPASDRNGSNRKCTKLHRNSNRLKIHTSKARKSRARAITAAVTDLTGPQTSLNRLRKPVELGKGRVQPPRALCWHGPNLTLCQEARNRQRSVFLPTQIHSIAWKKRASSPPQLWPAGLFAQQCNKNFPSAAAICEKFLAAQPRSAKEPSPGIPQSEPAKEPAAGQLCQHKPCLG